jgi:hypothetical protein
VKLPFGAKARNGGRNLQPKNLQSKNLQLKNLLKKSLMFSTVRTSALIVELATAKSVFAIMDFRDQVVTVRKIYNLFLKLKLNYKIYHHN